VKRILIVDDDEQMRLMMRRTLERRGYEIREADGGRKAEEVLGRFTADLIICDANMPGGGSVIRNVAGRCPGAKIVAISGHPPSDDPLDEAGTLGAHGVHRKPFQLDRLVGLVGELVGGAGRRPIAA
jgi:DNA-binding NtrC family response regulator